MDQHDKFSELHAGVREGPECEALAQLLSTLGAVDLNSAIATRGGFIRRDYGKSHATGLNAALVGATALEMQLQLVTLNLKHYPELDRLHFKKAYSKG